MTENSKKDYKKLYSELDIKYDRLSERHLETMNTLYRVRDLINDLQRTKKYDDVYTVMIKRVIQDIKEIVSNNITYEESVYDRQEAKKTDNN